ncbi:protein mab-21-like 3 [Lissotriton helveticus]
MSAQVGWGPLDPGTLKTFLEGQVLIRREDTSRALRGVLAAVEPLLQEVHAQDHRFSSVALRSGSYIEGLKVSAPDEFDLLVPLLGLPALCTVPASSLWGRSEQPPDASFQPVLVSSNEWCGGAGAAGLQDWLTHVQQQQWFPCDFRLVCQSRLIPDLVMQSFKALVRDVSSSGAGSVTVRPLQQGTPALTLTVTYHRKEISVDLVPVIKNPFSQWSIRWPRCGQSWPSAEKIQEIQETGVDLVAKHKLFWRYSFSRIERVLLEKIDEDGGRRRDSLRILKKVREDHWKTKYGKVLVSYHLKTVLFWACEEHPSENDWEDLTVSFKRLVNYLVFYLRQRNLPHYFLGAKVNLFKPEHRPRLQELHDDVIKFKTSPMEYFK